MRKLFFVGMLLSGFTSFACDVCGCTSIAMGFDDLNLSNRNAIGLRYGLRQFNSPTLSDYYHQTELTAIFSLKPKWQLQANLPFLIAEREQPGDDPISLTGLGDATLRLRYSPLYKIGDKSLQTLSLGVGMNMPTGRFEDREGSLLAPNFQTGTGSWDVLTELRYRLHLKKWRMGIQSTYLINNENFAGYTFGDQFAVLMNLAYARELSKKRVLMPNLALSYEHFGRDVNSRGYYQYGTGGQALNVLAGLSLANEDWLLSLRSGTNLFNESAGSYQPGFQFQFGINYIF